jgi:hypothetical protein
MNASSIDDDDDDEGVVPRGRPAARDAAPGRDGTEGAAGPSRANRMATMARYRVKTLKIFQFGINYKICLFQMALSLIAGSKTLALNTSKGI